MTRTPTMTANAALLATLPRLRRFARCLTGGSPAADSLVQTAAALALACGADDAPTLLHDVFRHCVTLWTELTAGGAAAASEAASPARSAHGVEAALAALPIEQRAVFALVAVEDCSYRATAALLDVSVPVVLGRLARARAVLAERLAQDAEPVLLARFEVAR